MNIKLKAFLLALSILLGMFFLVYALVFFTTYVLLLFFAVSSLGAFYGLYNLVLLKLEDSERKRK